MASLAVQLQYLRSIFANISLKSELLLAKLVCRGTYDSLLFSTGLALIQLSLKEEQPNICEGQNWLQAEAILLQLTSPTCGGGWGGTVQSDNVFLTWVVCVNL